MPESWRESSTVCPAMTRWVSPSVVPAEDPSRAVWLTPWASSGMWRCDVKLYTFLKTTSVTLRLIQLKFKTLTKCQNVLTVRSLSDVFTVSMFCLISIFTTMFNLFLLISLWVRHTVCEQLYSRVFMEIVVFCFIFLPVRAFQHGLVCLSYFYQFYLHSCVQSSPLLHHSSISCNLSLYSFSVWCHSTSHLSFHILWLFSHLAFSICSITYALCVSAHFRATRFMSEVVVPIVRDTLIWWENLGLAWSWLLPCVSLLPAWTLYKGYTNTEVNHWSFFLTLCLTITLIQSTRFWKLLAILS